MTISIKHFFAAWVVLLTVVVALMWHNVSAMQYNMTPEYTPQVSHTSPNGNYQYHGSPYNNYNYDSNGNPHSSSSSNPSSNPCVTYDGDYSNDTCN